ncbi:MAG: RNA polymerase sigma factor [Bacteroidota bacterium]
MKAPKQEIADEAILHYLQVSGDADRGFLLLMEKYQERLYWHIRRLVIEHEDANDVLQNCLVKVFRNIQRFEGKSKLYTWLYRIATNEAITYLQKQKKRKTDSIHDEESHLENQLKADSYFDGDQAAIQLQKALTTLPEKQRLVFQLRYFEERPYQEISDMLDTSVGALKASYHHAVKKIEKYVRQSESFLD